MEQVVREIHRHARKNFPRRKTIIKFRDDLFQIDIADFQQYAKQNRGFKYILFVIDCYSKYLWCKPLKNKSGQVVTKAFQEILEGGRIPNNLQSDLGLEFYNKTFSDLLKRHNINHYSTYSVKKAAIVERSIRTIKSILYRNFSLRGKYKWIDILDSIVEKYNDTKHSTTGYKPKNVTKNTNLSVYDHIKIAPIKTKFHVGDFVRISKYRNVFAKGYHPNWTTEIFKIRGSKN